jgi:hypothetical protein
MARVRVEKAILDVSDGKCFYCKAKATQTDHIVPISRGGTDDPTNLVPACRPCNSKKYANLLPPHIEVFALAHAKMLADRIAARGWVTYGSREGRTQQTLGVRISAEMYEAAERWCADQPAGPSVSAFFQYAIAKVLIDEGCLSSDYSARRARLRRRKSRTKI